MGRPIVFTVDNGYIKPLAVALQSLKLQQRTPRRIYIVHHRLHPLYRVLLHFWLKGTSLELAFLAIPRQLGVGRLPHHFSEAALLRLLVSERLAEPEFLYLDADVILTADLAGLDAFALQGAAIAGCVWPAPRDLRTAGFGLLFPYFASGVLVIDRLRFLHERIGERCLELINTHGFEYPDQDALNLVCRRWSRLPAQYNHEIPYGTPALALPPGGAVVLHVVGSEKPWHLFNRHPCRLRFSQLLRQTPFALLPPGPADIRWRSLASRLRQRLRGLAASRRAS